jgi:hypothetical protein
VCCVVIRLLQLELLAKPACMKGTQSATLKCRRHRALAETARTRLGRTRTWGTGRGTKKLLSLPRASRDRHGPSRPRAGKAGRRPEQAGRRPEQAESRPGQAESRPRAGKAGRRPEHWPEQAEHWPGMTRRASLSRRATVAFQAGRSSTGRPLAQSGSSSAESEPQKLSGKTTGQAAVRGMVRMQRAKTREASPIRKPHMP